MDEKIFFNNNNVTVSNSRFIVNGQTYAMSNVTSVKTGTTPPDRTGAVIAIIIGILCLFGGDWITFIGLALLAIGIRAWINSKAIYSVILNTSSGENQALSSVDQEYINNVISSLNESIVSRG